MDECLDAIDDFVLAFDLRKSEGSDEYVQLEALLAYFMLAAAVKE